MRATRPPKAASPGPTTRERPPARTIATECSARGLTMMPTAARSGGAAESAARERQRHHRRTKHDHLARGCQCRRARGSAIVISDGTRPPPCARPGGGGGRRARPPRCGATCSHSWPGRLVLAAAAVFGLSMAGVPLPEALSGLAGAILVLFGLAAVLRLARWLTRSPAALADPHQAHRFVPVHRRRAGHPAHGVLPARGRPRHDAGDLVHGRRTRRSRTPRSCARWRARRWPGCPRAPPASSASRPQLAQVRAMYPGVRHALVLGGRTRFHGRRRGGAAAPRGSRRRASPAPSAWAPRTCCAASGRTAAPSSSSTCRCASDLLAHVERAPACRSCRRAARATRGAGRPPPARATRPGGSRRFARAHRPWRSSRAHEVGDGEVDVEPVALRFRPARAGAAPLARRPPARRRPTSS